MKSLILCGVGLFLLGLSQRELRAQSFSWIRLGTHESEHSVANDIAADAQGNIYVGGVLNGPSRFGDLLLPVGGYILKYDPLGNLLWGRSIPEGEIRGIAVDNQRRTLWIVGDSAYRLYAARYDLNGDPLWVRVMTQEFGTMGMSISLDNEGNAYVGGIVDNRAYVARLNAEGGTLWEKNFSWPSSNPTSPNMWAALSSTFDSTGNLYVAMGYNSNAAIVKLNKNSGSMLWERRGTGGALPNVIKYDGNGHLLVGLSAEAGYSFDNLTFSRFGETHDAILRIDTEGRLVGSVLLENGTRTLVRDMVVDVSGKIHAVGFGAGALVIRGQRFPFQGMETVVLQFDRDLNPLRMVHTGAQSEGGSIAAGASGMYIAGKLRLEATVFGGIDLQAQGHNAFLAKLTPNAADGGSAGVKESEGAIAEAQLFPNPVAGTARLSTDGKVIDRVRVHSVDGRLVRSYDDPIIATGDMEISFEGLPSGLYYVYLQGPEGTSVVKALKQ